MRNRLSYVLTCIAAGVAFACCVPSPGAGAAGASAGAPAGASDSIATLGMELSDPTVQDAINLFKADKADDAIDLLDRTVKERTQGDPERNRELRLLAGIFAARATHKLPDVYARLRAAEGVNDSRSTTAKAEAARDAVKWAVKNGVKGDRPDLKKDDDWLRALDGAREDYAKELRLRFAKLDSAVRERTFRGIEPLVTTDKATLDRILVIKYLPEKGADIRSSYIDKLNQTADNTRSAKRTLHNEIDDLRAEKRKLPEQSGKRRQLDDKIEQKQKQMSEADDALEVLGRTIRAIPN